MWTTYVVRLIPQEEGGFSVLVPGLPGCVSQGETREEALANVKEAIEAYLEVAMEMACDGGELATVDVRVALNSRRKPSAGGTRVPQGRF